MKSSLLDDYYFGVKYDKINRTELDEIDNQNLPKKKDTEPDFFPSIIFTKYFFCSNRQKDLV